MIKKYSDLLGDCMSSHLLFENMNSAAILVDSQYDIVKANSVAESFFSQDSEALYQRNFLVMMKNKGIELNLDEKIQTTVGSQGDFGIIEYTVSAQGIRSVSPLRLKIIPLYHDEKFSGGVVIIDEMRLLTQTNTWENFCDYFDIVGTLQLDCLSILTKMDKDFFSMGSREIEGFFNKIPGSVYWKSKEGVYLGGNQGLIEVVGVESLDDLIGYSDVDFRKRLGWSSLGALRIRKTDELVMESRATQYNIRERVPSSLFKTKPVNQISNKVALHDSEGEVVGVLGVSLDIEAENTINRLK